MSSLFFRKRSARTIPLCGLITSYEASLYKHLGNCAQHELSWFHCLDMFSTVPLLSALRIFPPQIQEVNDVTTFIQCTNSSRARGACCQTTSRILSLFHREHPSQSVLCRSLCFVQNFSHHLLYSLCAYTALLRKQSGPFINENYQRVPSSLNFPFRINKQRTN